jgi:hypothetical protein
LHVEGWRIVVCFPADDEVVVVKIAPHNDANDPYAEIAGDLGLAAHIGPKTKPPCCDGVGLPPVAPDLVEQLEEAFSVLSQRQKRERSATRRR